MWSRYAHREDFDLADTLDLSENTISISVHRRGQAETAVVFTSPEPGVLRFESSPRGKALRVGRAARALGLNDFDFQELSLRVAVGFHVARGAARSRIDRGEDAEPHAMKRDVFAELDERLTELISAATLAEESDADRLDDIEPGLGNSSLREAARLYAQADAAVREYGFADVHAYDALMEARELTGDADDPDMRIAEVPRQITALTQHLEDLSMRLAESENKISGVQVAVVAVARKLGYQPRQPSRQTDPVVVDCGTHAAPDVGT